MANSMRASERDLHNIWTHLNAAIFSQVIVLA